MSEECLICKELLQYFNEDRIMKCSICHKEESSKVQCINGHYVCNDCHTSGMDTIISLCLNEKSRNPIEILKKMMMLPFCHMHGPEHHVMVGAALLTAYKNSGGMVELSSALAEMSKRGRTVPGGACGFWGACGAGISAGMYISIITNSTPLAIKAWSLSNQMTSLTLKKISENGGPRCCKRDSFLAVTEAVEFTRMQLGINMETGIITCNYSSKNNQCIKDKCPFYKKESL